MKQERLKTVRQLSYTREFYNKEKRFQVSYLTGYEINDFLFTEHYLKVPTFTYKQQHSSLIGYFLFSYVKIMF